MSNVKLAENYLTNHPSLGQASQSKVLWIAEILRPVLPARKDARILEIGPGRGEALALLKQDLGYPNVFAIDNSPEVAGMCRKIVGDDAMFCEDVFAFLAEEGRRFDLILMYHVLEHFSPAQVVDLVGALHGALDPGGVLVVGVPNAASPVIGPEQQHFDFTHQTGFSPWSLKQVMKIGGFTDVQVQPVWPPGNSLGRIVQRGLQKSLLAIMRLYLRAFTGEPRPVLTHSMVAYARRT